MNFVTKNLIDELKDLVDLKIKLISLDMPTVLSSDNIRLLCDFLDSEIEQHVKDIIHTEKL